MITNIDEVLGYGVIIFLLILVLHQMFFVKDKKTIPLEILESLFEKVLINGEIHYYAKLKNDDIYMCVVDNVIYYSTKKPFSPEVENSKRDKALLIKHGWMSPDSANQSSEKVHLPTS